MLSRTILAGLAIASIAMAEPLLIEVSPENTGSGPRSLGEARDRVRTLRSEGKVTGPVEVRFATGVYPVTEAVVFAPEDSGTLAAPVTYAAAPGAEVVISGGRGIGGWRQEGELWVAEVPEAAAGQWVFGALWVNGERRTLARTPTFGEYFFTAELNPDVIDPQTGEARKEPKRAFRYADGDLQPWQNLEDAVVWVFHAWESSAHHIERLDEANKVVLLGNRAGRELGQHAGPKLRYYVEGIFEGLDQPGEWYLNRRTGQVFYYPMPSEDLNTVEVVAPVARQLVLLEGRAGENAFVEHIQFNGLRFMHTDWPIGPEGHQDTQSAWSVPGAVHFRGARYCSVTHGEIAHTGTYGLWLAEGCAQNRVFHNEIHDLGAGGVRVGGMSRPTGEMKDESLIASHNVVDNNFIHDGGRIFHSGVGAFITHANYTTLSHNEICDFYYSGVSNGWVWGYGENPAHHNLIEYNHIHDLGKGVLSDMGGIYNLGIQSGTVLRHNLIHDVESYAYGGWGLYTDEGSTEMLLEYNVVYNTKEGNYDHHYGRNNRVRNNIFAFSKTDQLTLTRVEEHRSVVFENNIVLMDNGRVFPAQWTKAQVWSDGNLYWDVSGQPMSFGGLSFAEWQARGQDIHGAVGDPLFVDAKNANFRLRPESPALAMGFEPIDTGKCGLYGGPEWVGLPKKIQR
jgi:hypothetical protein